MIGNADIRGHWQREYIVAPGLEDRTTSVHWLQGNSVFADIRIPSDLPDISDAGCFADLGKEQLLEWARCEGFAGHATVDRNICQWTRSINWRGPLDGVDVGRLEWDEFGNLLEWGTQADYRELWHRIKTGPFRARIYGAGSWLLYLVSSGSSFLLAIDDTAALNASPLKDRLARALDDPNALSFLFRSQYTLGFWDGASAIAELSTNPFIRNRPILDRSDLDTESLVLRRQNFFGVFWQEAWTLIRHIDADELES